MIIAMTGKVLNINLRRPHDDTPTAAITTVVVVYETLQEIGTTIYSFSASTSIRPLHTERDF